MEILNKFEFNFYREIRRFLTMHFDTINEKEIVELFLLNIRNFRSENPEGELDDYLSTFPRLDAEWFKFIYKEYVDAAQSYGFYVSEFYDNCDDEYFRRLPERNFADLYSFFDVEFFENHRSIYMRRFKKYLFFFIHALETDSNDVFFIDDLLFEWMKSLRRYKTVKEDVSMKHDLVRITMLQYRMKVFSKLPSKNAFFLSDSVLNRIREYILNRIIARNPQLNVKYEERLFAWTPFRTDDACFKVRYSVKERIGNFPERLLFCALCPENEPVNCIITYNPFLGKEFRFNLSNSDIESVWNFVSLCNKNVVADKPLELPSQDECKLGTRDSTDQLSEPSHDEYNLSVVLPVIKNEPIRASALVRATVECEQLTYLIFVFGMLIRIFVVVVCFF